MFDRESLKKLQEQEENAFREQPEEMQKMARENFAVLSSSSLSSHPLGSVLYIQRANTAHLFQDEVV